MGLGVDGAASNEAGSLVEEARQALLLARASGGPEALTVRDALETATIGGARVLGWDDRIGSLEVGKEADVALWRLDTLPHADVVDPVAALVLGTRPPLELLLVVRTTGRRTRPAGDGGRAEPGRRRAQAPAHLARPRLTSGQDRA